MIVEHEFDPGDEDQSEKFRQFFNPHYVDSLIRNAIQGAWMIVPKEKRTVDEVEQQIRRMVDRAFRDMREDLKNFFGEDTAG
jgi:hypothetical protein